MASPRPGLLVPSCVSLQVLLRQGCLGGCQCKVAQVGPRRLHWYHAAGVSCQVYRQLWLRHWCCGVRCLAVWFSMCICIRGWFPVPTPCQFPGARGRCCSGVLRASIRLAFSQYGRFPLRFNHVSGAFAVLHSHAQRSIVPFYQCFHSTGYSCYIWSGLAATVFFCLNLLFLYLILPDFLIFQ